MTVLLPSLEDLYNVQILAVNADNRARLAEVVFTEMSKKETAKKDKFEKNAGVITANMDRQRVRRGQLAPIIPTPKLIFRFLHRIDLAIATTTDAENTTAKT